MEGGHRFLGTILDRVGHADQRAGLAVHRQPHRGLGLGLQLGGFGTQPVQIDPFALHQAQVAQQHLVAIHRGGDAIAGDAFKGDRFAQNQPPFARRAHNRLTQGMLRAPFGRGGEVEEVVSGQWDSGQCARRT